MVPGPDPIAALSQSFNSVHATNLDIPGCQPATQPAIASPNLSGLIFAASSNLPGPVANDESLPGIVTAAANPDLHEAIAHADSEGNTSIDTDVEDDVDSEKDKTDHI